MVDNFAYANSLNVNDCCATVKIIYIHICIGNAYKYVMIQAMMADGYLFVFNAAFAGNCKKFCICVTSLDGLTKIN